jgi:glutathionylspermidine synthase
VNSAIERYHDLLTPEVAADSHEWLHRQLSERGLEFGGRMLCSVLRPRFLSLDEYRLLSDSCARVLSAFEKARLAAMADSNLRKQFGLVDWEETLIHDDPGFRDASPTSRLDAFFAEGPDGSGLKFTEYNAETPAGAAYGDALTKAFLSLPVMSDFRRDYNVLPLPAAPGVQHSLLDAYRQWTGTREAPRIAIVDWSDVPTRSEFVLFCDFFKENGLECVIADPREMEYRNGKLYAGDFHVTLIYKRVLIDELINDCGLESDVVRAVRERAVCMVNPFRCKLLHKKASLAVVGDERNAHLFTEEERHAVITHIPWTRNVEERSTEFEGKKIDLIPWISENKDRLVLKPNDDYGGRGIVLGWTASSDKWSQAIRDALESPYIVQDKVVIPEEPFPALVNGELNIHDRSLDTAPYVSNGSFVEGCLTRISTDELLNVTAGGGSNVPTLLLEKR